MISGISAHSEARGRSEGAAVLVFPVRHATVPDGGREIGGGDLLWGEPVISPFGELPALSAGRTELEEEILALWEG
jgi:hypothetical protein